MSPAEFREKWEAQRAKLLTNINSSPQVMSLPPDGPPAPAGRRDAATTDCVMIV